MLITITTIITIFYCYYHNYYCYCYDYYYFHHYLGCTSGKYLDFVVLEVIFVAESGVCNHECKSISTRVT